MPWKRIAKIASVVIGGGIIGSGSGIEAADVVLTVSPEIKELINTVIGALLAYLALTLRAPKDEKEIDG